MKPIIFLCGLFFIVSASAAWAEEDYDFVASMQCSEIGPRHPKQTDASGQVLFKLDEDRQELFYVLKVENLKDAYMAHLHVGPCDEEPREQEAPVEQGPIAAWLYLCKNKDECVKGEFSGILAQGVITPADLLNDITFSDLIKAMSDGYAYANVHTKKYITCEICGPVIPRE
jgi:hypothetical protein